MSETVASFPSKLSKIFDPYRYKIVYGGRGSAKSWSFARALLIYGIQSQQRILCAREFQNSIKQSVHTLLCDQIKNLNLGYFYKITNDSIIGRNGTSFNFTGLSVHTVDSIKSFEGCDKVWVEEGQTVSKKSWDILIPTIRKTDSEIWVSFNPFLDTDDTYRRFVLNTPPNTLLVSMNWHDNEWWNDILEAERSHCQITDPDNYDNIWEGKPLVVAAGAIYANEYKQMVEEKRITLVRPDPLLKTHLFFDLGWNDSMAIIAAQRAASEIRVIDYVEDDHKTLLYYSDLFKEKNYNFGYLFLPHDGQAKDYKTGQSADEILTAQGWTVDVEPVGSIENGIRVARQTFPRVWMNDSTTGRLQECLKRYQRKINPKTNEPMGPQHDEFSHGADVFRLMAMCADRMVNNTVRRKRSDIGQRAGGWLG